MEKKRNKKGFTLAELLIVVAIIAVLVAIAIPVFTSQLERSREATDAANIRAGYAEVMTEILDGSYSSAKEVTIRQTAAGWKNSDALAGLEALGDNSSDATVTVSLGDATTGPVKGGKVTITYTESSSTVAIAYN